MPRFLAWIPRREDMQELTRASVALVVAKVVAEAGLFDRLAARHDVQQQPSGRCAGTWRPGVRPGAG
jgi:hypothetical protein